MGRINNINFIYSIKYLLDDIYQLYLHVNNSCYCSWEYCVHKESRLNEYLHLFTNDFKFIVVPYEKKEKFFLTFDGIGFGYYSSTPEIMEISDSLLKIQGFHKEKFNDICKKLNLKYSDPKWHFTLHYES